MGRYQFVSPGASAGGALLETLARQREEARRAMLDEVAAKDSESRRMMTQEQILSSQASRMNDAISSVKEANEAGNDLSGIDPDILKEMKKRGMVSAAARPPIPNVDTSMSDVVPTTPVDPNFVGPTEQAPPEAPTPVAPPAAPPNSGNYYVGGQKDFDEKRKSRVGGEILTALQNPNLSQTERMGLFFKAASEGIQIPAGVATSLQPQAEMFSFDDETGKSAPILDQNGKPRLAGPGDPAMVHRSRPTREPAERFFQSGVDDTGHGVYVGNMTGNEHIGKNHLNAKPSNAGAGAGKKGRATVPATLLNKLSDAYKIKQTAAKEAAIYQAGENIISAYDTTPDVRDTVRAVLRGHKDPKSGKITPDTRTLPELIEDHSTPDAQGHYAFDHNGTLDQDQMNQFSDLLALVRGSQ